VFKALVIHPLSLYERGVVQPAHMGHIAILRLPSIPSLRPRLYYGMVLLSLTTRNRHPLLWYSDVTLEFKPMKFGYRSVLTHNPSEL